MTKQAVLCTEKRELMETVETFISNELSPERMASLKELLLRVITKKRSLRSVRALNAHSSDMKILWTLLLIN